MMQPFNSWNIFQHVQQDSTRPPMVYKITFLNKSIIFFIILLYNKETVPRTLCSLSASASRVAVTGADTALYNFETVFLKNEFIFY